MNRRMFAVVSLCLMGVLVAMLFSVVRPSFADDQNATDEQSEHDRWMAAKLNSAQEIFDHLTHGNFEGIEENARRMQVINLLEQWARDEAFERRSDYIGQLNAFEFAVKELVRHAQDENTDGTLQSYLDMSASCVRCHELIRDVD